MAYEINDLKRFLLITLLSLPGVAMTNINCHGKPFHCINSTHFIICVDMGGGVTTTIDNFMIPCPPTTVCHETNRYECEFPPSDPKPPLEVIGISNESENSVSPSVTNSATTTKPSSILLLDTTIEINAVPTEQVNLKQRPKFEVPDKLMAQPDTLKIMGTNQMTTNDSKSQTKLTDVTESSHNQSGLIHSTTETYKETNLTGSSTFTADANIDTFNLTTTTESNPNHSNIENITSNVPPDISLPKTSTFSEVSIETTTTIADFGILNYSVVNNTQNNLNSTPISFSTTEPMPSTNDPNYKSNNYTTSLPIVQSISIADYHTKPQKNITSTEAQLNNITIPPVLSLESSNNSKSEYKKTNNPETTYIEKTLDKYNVDNKSSNTTESQNNNSVNKKKSNVVESTNSSLISDQDSKLNDETFQLNLTTISTTDAPKITTFERSTEIPLVTSSFLDNKNASSSKSNDLRLKMALTKEELPNTTGIDIKVEYTISGNSIVLNTNLTQNTHKIPENENEYSNNSQGLEMDLSNTTQSNITVTFTLSNVVTHDVKLNHSVLSYEKSNQSLNNSNLNSTNHSFNNISANNYGNKNITMGTLPGEYKNNLTETLNYTQIEKNTTKDKKFNYTETATNIVISKEKTKDYQVKLETTQESAANLNDIAIKGNTDSLSIVNNNTNYSTITNNTIMFDNSTNKANNSIKLDDNVALVLKQYNASNITITKQDATNQSLNQSKINNSKIPINDISKQSDFSDISLQNNSFVITSTNSNLIHLSSLSGNFTNVVNKTVIVSPQDLSIPNELNLTTPGEVFTTDTSNTTNNNVLYNQTVIYDPISYNNASDLSILNKKYPNNTTTTRAIESNTKLSAIKNERQATVAPLLKTTYQIDTFFSESIPSTNILSLSTVKYHINAFSNQNQLINLAVTMKKNQSSLSTVTDNIDFIPVTLKPNKETSQLFTRNTTVTTTQKAIVQATTRDWTTPTETSTIQSITKLSTIEDKEKPTTVAPVKTTNQIHEIQSVSILSSNISLSSTVKNDTNPNHSENLVVTMKIIPSDLSTVTTKIDTIPITLKPYKATTLSLTNSTSATDSDTSFVPKKAMAQAAASDLTNKQGPKVTNRTGVIENITILSNMKDKEKQTTVAPEKITDQLNDILLVSNSSSTTILSSTVKYDSNVYSNQNQSKNLAVTMKTNRSNLSTATDNIDFIPVTLKPNKETSPLLTRNTTVTTTDTSFVTQKAIVQATTRDWTTPTETSTIRSITKLSTIEDKEKPTTVAPVKTTNQIHDIQSVSILSSNISLSSTVKNDTNPNHSENLVVTMKIIPSDLSTVTTKIDTIPITLKPYKATTLSLTNSTSATDSDTSFVPKKAMAQAAASDLTNKQGPKVTNRTGVIENITILSNMKDKEKQTTVAPEKITDQLNDILLVSNSSSTTILSSTVKYDSNVYSNQNQSKNLAVMMKTNRSDLSTATDNIDFIPVTLKPNKETSPLLTRNTTVTTTDTSFVTQKAIVQATTRDWTTPTETSTIRSITKLSTIEDKEKPTTVAPVKTTNQINDIQSISILSSNISLSSTVKNETNPNQSENFVVTMKTIPSDLSTVTTKIDTIPTLKPYKATTPSFTSSTSATDSDTSFVLKKAMAQAATSDLTNKPVPKDTNTTGEKQTTVSLVEITDQLNDILLVSSPSSTTLPSSTVKYDSNVYSNQNQSKHLVVTTKTIQNNLSMVTAKVETLPVTSKPYTTYSTSETIPIVISTTMSRHTSFVTPKAMTQATQQNVLKITPSETGPKQQVQDNNMDASTVIHGEMKLTTATYLNLQETVQTATKISSDMTGKVTDTNVSFNIGIPTQLNKPESLKFVTQSFTTQTEHKTVNFDIKSATEKYLYPTQSNANIHNDGRINNTTTLVEKNLKVNTKTVSINKTVSQFINGDITIIQSLNDTNSIAKNQTVLKLNLLKENIYNIKMPETNILTTVEPNSMIETIEVNQNKTITAHLGDLILSEGMYAKVTSKSSSKLDTPKISTEVISHEVKEIKHINKNLAEQFLPEKLEVQSPANNNFKASVVSEESATKQTNMIKPYASFHNTSVNNLQGIPTANTTAKQSNISLNTININIKTIIMSNSNKKNPNTSASVFDCSNRSRGRYADNNDCIKFYICIGKLQPITGFCPNNTVFSAIYKHCTKNLSHCVRNNQFRCLREGRFSDFFQDNVYYVCVKSSNNTFLRFKLQCQKDHQLNKTTMTCQKIADMSSQSFSSISESEVSNNRSIPKKSPKTITKASFICPKEGRFSHATDSRKYYECKKNNKEEYRQRIRKCACDEIYSEKKQKCIESDSNDC